MKKTKRWRGYKGWFNPFPFAVLLVCEPVTAGIAIATVIIGAISGYQQAQASKEATKATKKLTREEMAQGQKQYEGTMAQGQKQYEGTMAFNKQQALVDAQQKALDREWQQKEFDRLYGPQGFYTKQQAAQDALKRQEMQNLYGIPTQYGQGTDYLSQGKPADYGTGSDYLAYLSWKNAQTPNPYYKAPVAS